jgi:hypothetical protein
MSGAHAASRLCPPQHPFVILTDYNFWKFTSTLRGSASLQLMAELSLAASIVGLVSLGIQIDQGLSLYIDSASNAKPRCVVVP